MAFYLAFAFFSCSNKSHRTKMILRALGVVVGFSSVVIGLYMTGLLSPKCHSTYPNTINHLGTKTPYLFADDVISHYPEEGCSAEQLWIIVRHGSRLPGAELINKIRNQLPSFRDEIVANHAEGRGSLCEETLNSLKTWKPHPGFQESQEKWLIPQGELEVEGIARRYQERFPTLLNVTYSKELFKLKYTKTERAKDSANSFAKALFQSGHKDVWYPPALKADPILRFYKSCKKWQQNVDDNPEAYKERDIFGQSYYFQTALEQMRDRLGSMKNLTLDQLELAYTTCAFETAWHPDHLSKWCSIFTKNDFQLFEYRSDVKYYWIDGYGYEITYNQACAPVRDVLEHFKDKIAKPNESPNVIAYFTHSGTLLKLISRLGLFKDDIPLLGNNYHLHGNRKWRTSQIDKFATNLAFVLFKCPNNNYKVGTYFQEKPTILDACQHTSCHFEKFKTNLEQTIDTCDVETMCKVDK